MPRKSKEKKVEVMVEGLGINGGDPFVILKTADEIVDGKGFLPIIIGPFEATSIVIAMGGTPIPRPLTHDFSASIIKAMGGILAEVVVTKVVDNTFYAIAIIKKGRRTIRIDCRPSDAIAVALRVPGCKIFIHKTLLIEQGKYRLKLERVDSEESEEIEEKE